MKVVLSSNGDNLESIVDPRFGRCQKFIVVDTETMDIRVLDNSAGANAHGAGTAAAQKVVNANADAVVTGHVGPNAFTVLNTAGVKMYSLSGVSVKEALNLLDLGKVPEITEPGAAHHGGRK